MTGRVKRSTTIRDRHRSVIARGQPPCAICGEPIDYTLRYPHEKSFVVDHKIPLKRGGADTLDNKQASHRACNAAKAARLVTPITKRSQSFAWPD